jgi:hypothetical protein
MLPRHFWSVTTVTATALRSSTRNPVEPIRSPTVTTATRDTKMRHEGRWRPAWALFFAVLAGVAVAWANPIDRIKADLRADTQGLVISFEVAANAVEG